ncbi:MAG: hypothetical protein GFH27_549281n407 [Chloroflexi bacterium AL-W]|nr:hypothetical protein [Chloroflexi bacterium AL-N1]NOK66293.1 hypothetical protein [Chloroflexi bacterium AL-N10]NOK73173.1 hypothetical protein [Chloroflexi bacterium AL-N5]NOK80070.1 hypothetical protein [Chloroflexi bacterium AL-W]NOK88075.1 hypothetical protein [Chloroflexi bacterium AL-N15]
MCVKQFAPNDETPSDRADLVAFGDRRHAVVWSVRLTVATFLAFLLTRKVAMVEQRRYEWCVEAPTKRGATARPSL